MSKGAAAGENGAFPGSFASSNGLTQTEYGASLDAFDIDTHSTTEHASQHTRKAQTRSRRFNTSQSHRTRVRKCVIVLIASVILSLVTFACRKWRIRTWVKQHLVSDKRDQCPGYRAKRYGFKSKQGIWQYSHDWKVWNRVGSMIQPPENIEALHVDLELAGRPCDIYGVDLKELRLEVEFQSTERLHVKVFNVDEIVYQVPEELIPTRHLSEYLKPSKNSLLAFSMTPAPFSFAISRRDSGIPLFNTSASSPIFESQYLRLRTQLPIDPYLYGLGEHSDSFHLPTTNYTRTLWNRDAGGAPPGENLYGSHPVYFDHRGGTGTHGVFLLNSNGMAITIDRDTHSNESGSKPVQYLEYNALGGIFDFYFLAGPSATDVSRQYSEIVGKPAMPPYWTLGFHQCKFGLKSIEQIENVVANYSEADIPLEAMWIDIDYMDRRRILSLDPEGFPRDKVGKFVKRMHDRGQKVVMMVDPAVYSGNPHYGPYLRGVDQDVFLHKPARSSSKRSAKQTSAHLTGVNDSSLYQGIVWPGPVSFPDFFHNPSTQSYWTDEIGRFFFNPANGRKIDVDGIWIDMNEVSQFCDYPCDAIEDSNKRAIKGGQVVDSPSVDALGPRDIFNHAAERNNGVKKGLPARDLLFPSYDIGNKAGKVLSDRTLDTDILHANGLAEYDVHNLYGLTMAHATHQSLLYHNPHSRPFLLTRSTYPSFSRYSSHWLGDNLSTFPSLRQSLSGLLQFTSIYQNPHVGADVCGFLHNTTEELCARWAAVGALAYPFYRNHAVDTSSPQEYYRWDDTVGEAARRAIEIRYRLLDYMYTAMERQSRTGEASLVLPLWFLYPEDPHAADIQEAFFLGDALLVSPVLYEGATSVDVHIPPDSLFYRFDLETYNFTRIHGSREMLSISGIDPKTPPPLHIRAGCAIPLRTKIPMAQPNARTTTELRRHNFEVFIAPDDAGYAEGSLYIDDGMSHRPREDATSLVEFTWSEGRVFTMRGRMNYQPPENSEESTLLQYVYILGAKNRPRRVVRASPRHEGSGAERGEPRAAGWRDELEIDYYPSAQMLVAWVSAPMARDLEGGGYSFEVLW